MMLDIQGDHIMSEYSPMNLSGCDATLVILGYSG